MKPDFEWDPEKAEKNLQKHEVSFEEASSVFDDPMFITVLDDEHSDDEERYITIGISNKTRLLLVAHTERDNRIRIISARKATKHEEKFYEETE
ncbi:MAG: BrnT family toxin [Anaerolineales bacterium]|nr:BrnT family toxin [Anaerolineales bacterium]HNQ95472.1 BrnT family toxin [Anaerolineales bacterium]